MKNLVFVVLTSAHHRRDDEEDNDNTSGENERKDMKEENASYLYNLYGVVVHQGRINSGHYIR